MIEWTSNVLGLPKSVLRGLERKRLKVAKISARLDAITKIATNLERDWRMKRSLEVLKDNPTRFFPLLGMDSDDWQLRLINQLAGIDRQPIKRAVLACGRQVGKSTLLSIYAAYLVMCKAQTVAVAAPSFRQSLELAQKIRRIIQRFNLVSIARDAIIDLRLSNGGRLVALPPSGTGRGFTLDALLVDEAAFLTERSDLLEALAPALALSDGQLILASSPGPPSGLLYDAWKSEDWIRVKVRCDECKRISPEFLEQQRILLTPDAYRREFEAEFCDMGGTLIPASSWEACVSDKVSEWLEI